MISVAMAISAYLLGVSLSGGATAGCGPDSSCHEVLSSRWAYGFGLPVSALALGVDAGILLCLWLAQSSRVVAWRARAEVVLVLLATLVAGAAVWFTVAQVGLIGAVCPYCMAAHTCGLGAATLLLVRLLARGKRVGPWLQGFRAALAGLGGVGLLIASQVLYEPPTHRVTTIPAASANPPGPASRATNLPAASRPSIGSNLATLVTDLAASPVSNTPAVPRLLTFHGGQFEFDLREIPVLGSPDAPHVAVSLVDYTCDHCRVLHHHLAEVLNTFSNELALACLPMPLNTNCNPLVRRNAAANTNACEYAELALAVWRTNRAQFRAFDAWLFEGARPPSLEAARERAEGLVGLEAVPQALADPWVREQIRRNVALYVKNYEVTGSTRMPQLMFGSQISEGRLRTTEDLYELIEAQLGLKRPPPPDPLPPTDR